MGDSRGDHFKIVNMTRDRPDNSTGVKMGWKAYVRGTGRRREKLTPDTNTNVTIILYHIHYDMVRFTIGLGIC